MDKVPLYMLNGVLDEVCEGPNEIDAYTLIIPSYAGKYTFETRDHDWFYIPVGADG